MKADPLEFRSALGQFLTGVTVVTTNGGSGQPVGLTANSFNSVSLDPPLVLWSLAKTSCIYQDFLQTSAYAIHVLRADQQHLSIHFASSEPDRFANLEFDRGLQNIPLLANCAARFQCRALHQYDGGDHTIFVGQVEKFDYNPSADVLAYHRGDYMLVNS